jgi:hypothetical protein
MTYSVPCECGNSVEASATQAGTDIPCSCGRCVSVPLLSRLRQTAGQEAYEAGTIETINRMVRTGELPSGDTCAFSGLPTVDSYNPYVQCESTWLKESRSERPWFAILAFLFLPFRILGWLLRSSRVEEEPRVMGRDRGVSTPLRVRGEHQPQLRRTNQSKLREMLRTVPIYATLLDEFPKARIIAS